MAIRSVLEIATGFDLRMSQTDYLDPRPCTQTRWWHFRYCPVLGWGVHLSGHHPLHVQTTLETWGSVHTARPEDSKNTQESSYKYITYRLFLINALSFRLLCCVRFFKTSMNSKTFLCNTQINAPLIGQSAVVCCVGELMEKSRVLASLARLERHSKNS